jgi:aryl-alcohol dehydrogenase-like predicted oxidoreductase
VTPLAETLGALGELADEGKIRAFGVSNLDAAQLREAAALGDPRLAALQNEYSLLERGAERELLPLCREHGIGFVPYFPLARGMLTGKFRRGEPPPGRTRMAARPELLTDAVYDRLEALEAFAAQRGHSVLELAFAGLASQPGVSSVIAGAMSPEQVAANAAAGEWELGSDDLAALAAL